MLQIIQILAMVYFLLFSALAWRNFRVAVGFLVILLPTYLLRFDVLGLPSTFLEAGFEAVFLVWLVKYFKKDLLEIWLIIKQNKFFFVFVCLFFIASAIGVFVSDMVFKSLGQWRAYFLEPIILFFILIGRRKEITGKDLILFLGLSCLSISIYCLVQAFTGWGIATTEWSVAVTRRVTAFYTSPNAVGLYLGPIMMLILAMVVKLTNDYVRDDRTFLQNENRYWILGCWVLFIMAFLAVFFTKSQGTWVALGAGLTLFVYLIDYKKIALGFITVGVILSLVVPNIKEAVLFQDKAGQNRLTLWQYSGQYLTQSPTNFIFGAGIRQFFRKVQKPHYDDKSMERLIYSHNIFLNFWTEIGLLGMISFVGILVYLFYFSKKILTTNKYLGAGLLSALAVIVVHGLVDVPYFKNDLAMMTWTLFVVVVVMSVEISDCEKKKRTIVLKY